MIHNAIPKEARTYEDVIQPVLNADGTEQKDEEGKAITQVVGKNIIVDPEKEEKSLLVGTVQKMGEQLPSLTG